MDSSFYKNIPSWMIRYLAHAKCGKCSNIIKKSDITAIGVRGHEDKTTPYVEYQCPSCNYRAMKSFGTQTNGSIEEICYMLLEESQNKKRIRQAKVNESKNQIASMMTDTEVNKFINNMNKYTTFDELLKEIGATSWLEKDEN